jgi:putative DNA primase/helicase
MCSRRRAGRPRRRVERYAHRRKTSPMPAADAGEISDVWTMRASATRLALRETRPTGNAQSAPCDVADPAISVVVGMLMVSAESLARALGGRRVGSQWMALCPAHNDRSPSLAIQDGNGKVLVKCHGGCEQDVVIEALKALGLWPEAEEPVQRIVVDEYSYADAAGNLLFQVVRFSPKSFAQRYPDGQGSWIWKKHPQQVLYRLPEVLEAPIVLLVEGEKDVETLRNHGFVATTNAGGAKAQWLPGFSDALRGREVNIIPDNDQPGWDRAIVVARALLGKASRIRIIDLPKDTKDITDWFAAGHTECELISLLEVVHAV